VPIDPAIAGRFPLMEGVTVADLMAPSPEVQSRLDAFSAPYSEYRAPEAAVTERSAPGPHGNVPVRVYSPRAPSGAGLVWMHGGAFMAGDLDMPEADSVARELCARTGAVVVSVDYRLAPEHRMPTAAEDAYAATVWLAAHAADVGADGARLAVAGDSAGGNLAAVVCLLARDRGGPDIAHQVLVYPGTDGTLSSPSLEENANGPLLTRASVRAYRALYLGPGGDERDVRLSPLLADDLSNLPPALIQSAELDPIRDDASRYAEALQKAGTTVRYTEYAGAPHGYLSIPGAVRGARQAMAEIVTELRTHLNGRTPEAVPTVGADPSGPLLANQPLP
jgi:acetyl esterase/lipase